MLQFEPESSTIENNSSANCVTTNTLYLLLLFPHPTMNRAKGETFGPLFIKFFLTENDIFLKCALFKV